MQKLIIERRRKKRLNTLVFADICDIRTGVIVGGGVITNISTGGIQIETKEEIAKQDEFILKFSLPNGVIFTNIHGVFVRKEKDSFTYVYGIKFTRIRLIDKLKIKWFMHTYGDKLK